MSNDGRSMDKLFLDGLLRKRVYTIKHRSTDDYIMKQLKTYANRYLFFRNSSGFNNEEDKAFTRINQIRQYYWYWKPLNL